VLSGKDYDVQVAKIDTEMGKIDAEMGEIDTEMGKFEVQSSRLREGGGYAKPQECEA
jgi:hypothetical protein